MRRMSAWLLCSTLVSGSAFAQTYDMEAMAKWSKATVVRYHIEGVFSAWTPVSHADEGSQGKATDKVTIDLDWDLKAHKLVGTPKIVNSKTRIDGLRNTGAPCKPPVLKGDFDQFDVRQIIDGDGEDRVQVKGVRSYPPADVALDCPGGLGLRASPAKQIDTGEWIALPAPLMLALGTSTAKNVVISPDHKSFILKLGDWSWTYTPSLVK